MKKVLHVLLIGTCFSCAAQNLVPNPSFEDTTMTCAQFLMNPIPPGNVAYWFNPTGGTPDYFNGLSCGGVPTNIFGSQTAHSGNAYAGILTYATVGGREYIACPLLIPLTQGVKYCVNFYVSAVEKERYRIDGMGALFTIDTATCPGYCLLPYTPQISNSVGNVLSDTVNWMRVSGMFIATGGEKFITIGNFTPDSDLTIQYNPSGIYNDSYYYIDDVSVEEMQVDTADAGGDKTICGGDSVQIGVSACNDCIYTWQPATGLSDSSAEQPQAFPAQTTTYFLMVRDTSTGTICDWTSTDTVTVTVIPFTPQAADAGADATLCKGESVTLGTAPCGNCIYQWQPFNNLSSTTIAQPIATPTQNTSYILVMTDSFPPCAKTTTDTVNVFVNDCPTPEQPIEIFNIFTPNGDTKNETFFIKNLPPNSHLQMFNRWGSKIYESSNYDNAWNGKGAPDGTYYFILILSDKKNYHGFVEIRR